MDPRTGTTSAQPAEVGHVCAITLYSRLSNCSSISTWPITRMWTFSYLLTAWRGNKCTLLHIFFQDSQTHSICLRFRASENVPKQRSRTSPSCGLAHLLGSPHPKEQFFVP